MHVHRLGGEAEALGDALHLQPLGQQLGYLPLPVRGSRLLLASFWAMSGVR